MKLVFGIAADGRTYPDAPGRTAPWMWMHWKHSWACPGRLLPESGVTKEQVYERCKPTIERGSPVLWSRTRALVHRHFAAAQH